MARIPIRSIPGEPGTPAVDSLLVMDDGVKMSRTTTQAVVDAVAPVASQGEAEAGVDNTKRMTSLRVKQSIAVETAPIVSGLGEHIADTENPHSVTKDQVGLGNVDNTSDANKPISSATQSALDEKLNLDGSNSDIDALTFSEITTPTNPAADKFKLYFKDDGELYRLGGDGAEGRIGPDLSGYVRNSENVSPVNEAKLFVSDVGWDPDTDPRMAGTTSEEGLTTPRRARFVVGGYYDVDGGGGVDYLWNIMGYQVNPGTAPVTPLMARARGNVCYPLSSSSRGYGKTPQLHGLEITVGAFASEATATRESGSPVLTGIADIEAGSRFEADMPIVGDGIPDDTVILSVTGRPGAPTEITMSANATSSGTDAISATPVTPETIGVLITGNGYSSGATGNPNGIGVQFQSYNNESRFLRCINIGPSALLPTGRAIRVASVTADRVISVESCTLAGGIIFASGTLTGPGIAFNSLSGTIGLDFPSTSTFSTAAIRLAAQNIATDTTTGMKIGTASTQKIGFFGATPVVRPSGVTVSADGIHAALVSLGLIAA